MTGGTEGQNRLIKETEKEQLTKLLQPLRDTMIVVDHIPIYAACNFDSKSEELSNILNFCNHIRGTVLRELTTNGHIDNVVLAVQAKGKALDFILQGIEDRDQPRISGYHEEDDMYLASDVTYSATKIKDLFVVRGILGKDPYDRRHVEAYVIGRNNLPQDVFPNHEKSQLISPQVT